MKIFFIKKDGKFTPLDEHDLEMWYRVKDGTPYCAEIRKPRNYEHHKKIFAIAKIVIDNAPDGSAWCGKEPISLIKAAELQLGYVEQQIKLDGEVVLVPESISFESWDQDKFNEFYKKALEIFSKMLDITVDDLENNAYI